MKQVNPTAAVGTLKLVQLPFFSGQKTTIAKLLPCCYQIELKRILRTAHLL